MLLEQVRSVKDQTGHLQIPLDLARITKERLEKKIKQRQRRPNNLALTADGLFFSNYYLTIFSSLNLCSFWLFQLKELIDLNYLVYVLQCVQIID